MTKLVSQRGGINMSTRAEGHSSPFILGKTNLVRGTPRSLSHLIIEYGTSLLEYEIVIDEAHAYTSAE